MFSFVIVIEYLSIKSMLKVKFPQHSFSKPVEETVSTRVHLAQGMYS